MTAETDLDAPFAPDWVLVPRTPTDAMLRAAQDAWMNDPLRRTTTMWRAMLAAAPQQPAAVDGAKETDLWRCTVCGRVGTVGRCCGEETRERANMEPLQAKVEALRAEVERLNRLLGRIVEGDGDSTLTIRAGTDAFAAAREYLSKRAEQENKA